MSILDYFKKIENKDIEKLEINKTNLIKEQEIIEVFTDGSSFNNGKKNAQAGFGVYFGENDIRNISKKVINKQTNNVGELLAIYNALLILSRDNKLNDIIKIYTDSEYCLKIFQSHYNKYKKICNPWIIKWKMKDFKDVKNKDIIKNIDKLLLKFKNVEFIHVRSHKTAPLDITSKEYRIWFGNKQADILAQKGAKS